MASCRDYGLLDSAGSVQSSGNHFFGMRTAIQFEAGPSRSIGDRFSDAEYGAKIVSNASGSHIADGTTEHCWFANVYADAQRTRVHNTRILVANTDTMNHPGINVASLSRIIGLYITGNGLQSMVTDCEIEVGVHTFAGDTNLVGSTGLLLDADHVIIDNLKIQGSSTAGEIGIRVRPSHYGGDFFIDARGGGFLTSAGDRVVKFDAPGMGQHCEGQNWYILHHPNDTPVEISADWGPTLKIFTRSNIAGDWIQLTTGKAYP